MKNDLIDQMVTKLLELKNEQEAKHMKIKDAKIAFFYCLQLKNSRDNTIKYYQNIFYYLDNFFAENKIDSTKQLDDKLLENLINGALDKGLSPNYINKLVGTIKTMARLLCKHNFISKIDFTIEKLHEVEHRIDSIEKAILHKILNYVQNESLKLQVIVNLLNDTGIRRTELVNILLSNIDYESRTIILEKTKSGEIRRCFFTESTKNIIINYLNEFKPVKYLLEGNIPGEAFSPRSVNKALEKIKACLNLEQLSAHMFRHTFGTRIYCNSQDLEITRELLGHTDYTMTKRYIHNSSGILKTKYDKYNIL